MRLCRICEKWAKEKIETERSKTEREEWREYSNFKKKSSLFDL